MLVNWVVVLGDFGRSPRMQYHTASLASKPNSVVHVVAYGGAAPMESLSSAPNVHITYLPEVPHALMRLPGLLRLVAKVLHQLVSMAWIMLVALPSPSNILMQNPPAIPTMVLCWLAARRHGAALVVDWHNFGYSIMALKHAPSSLLVRTARAHELAWGASADKAFCVTAAMRAELSTLSSSRIDAAVLYDRPPSHFHRTAAPAAHSLLVRLAPSIAAQDGGVPGTCDDWAAREASSWGPSRTAVTHTAASPGQAGVEAVWRPGRPAVLVSSTSWTPDEDFGILLDALVMYEQVRGQWRH
jgi:beta-1,4-mannosyltransferase